MSIIGKLIGKVKTDKEKKRAQDYEHLGRMLANIYETGYINRNQTYKMSFIKGILAGLGGVIGATLVVALLIWILSLLSNVPLVNTITDNVENTIQQKNTR